MGPRGWAVLRRAERAGGQTGEKSLLAEWGAGARVRSRHFVSGRPGHPDPGDGTPFCTAIRSFDSWPFFFFSLPNLELGLWILIDGLV